MGYTTEFNGFIKLSRKLTMAEAKELLTYADDPDNVPTEHPRSYLQWVPSRDLDAIGWDGNEKFYDYVEWLKWVCDWLKGYGIECCGAIQWSGESSTDTGEIQVLDNVVTVLADKKQAVRFTPITLHDLAEMALEQVTA